MSNILLSSGERVINQTHFRATVRVIRKIRKKRRSKTIKLNWNQVIFFIYMLQKILTEEEIHNLLHFPNTICKQKIPKVILSGLCNDRPAGPPCSISCPVSLGPKAFRHTVWLTHWLYPALFTPTNKILFPPPCFQCITNILCLL